MILAISPPPRRYIFAPEMASLRRWDSAMLVALVFTALVTPYEVG